MENEFFVDSQYLSKETLAHKHELETNPDSRTNHMEYMEGMEQIESDVCENVMSHMKAFDYSKYTAKDVRAALEHDVCSIEDFKALLSPAAEPFLEEIAQKARLETSKHFGNTVYLFTPLYIANYCENYCVYCGFNCYNHINRMKLSMEQIEHEMQVIAESGMEEILILTGESRAQSDVKYIGEACKLARNYFRLVGIEIYPVNTDEYRYLHECGADYVTVFQETYDTDKYETLHLLGHKRVWPYRFDAQERALRAGMRGVAFSALLGLSDFRKDALATALHVYYLQRKYPHAEMSLSCPRLRPIINNDKINPLDVHEKQLCQIICAYRIFLPYVGITVSSRESARFRDGIVKIAATKVSAGVSTGIGDHEAKYSSNNDNDVAKSNNMNNCDNNNCDNNNGNNTSNNMSNCNNNNGNNNNPISCNTEKGDEQFEIADSRSLDKMYSDITEEGLQPVLNDYIYM
ncbi:MAG: 2-iminoacetate synthase ThiH [Lachnospiraceae bacterium]|nr:2-iminoacetate synthase ThiH [Lachnospiraceae bacterium]